VRIHPPVTDLVLVASCSRKTVKKKIERNQFEELVKRITRLGYARPSAVAASERPDLIVTTRDEQIGVETTAAVYQEYVRAGKLHHKVCPDQCIDTTYLKDSESRRSNDELIEKMLSLNTEWKDSEQDMYDWRDKIAKSLEQKRAKLNSTAFQTFSQNWLLIYDEPSLANDTFTHDRACQHAAAIFSAPHAGARDFNSIYFAGISRSSIYTMITATPSHAIQQTDSARHGACLQIRQPPRCALPVPDLGFASRLRRFLNHGV
jgi:hypothetical protein